MKLYDEEGYEIPKGCETLTLSHEPVTFVRISRVPSEHWSGRVIIQYDNGEEREALPRWIGGVIR